MARDPKAEVEISAHSRGLSAKLREARAKFGTFGNELKKNVFGKDLVEGGFWSKGGAQLVGNLGANAIGAIGGFLADQGKEIYQFEKQLTRLGIASGKTPEQMRAFADSVLTTSNATGISRNGVLSAARAYVALTGDMNGAAAASDTWARVAQATDSNIEDVARTAASLKQNLKIDPRDMEAAFSALAVQGKEGAIELKDLAGQMANIAPQWAMFKGGSGLRGMKEMGAALQVVKQGFGGDASETVTGLQGLLTALVKNSGRFKSAGIKIFDRDPITHAKTMRNVLDIVNDISNSKLVNDPAKLEKAFGRVEAYRAFIQLSQNKQMLQDLIEKSGDTKVIANDLQKYLESPAGRIEKAWEGVKNKIAEATTPERIEALTQAIVALTDAMAATVDATAAMLGALDVEGALAKKITDRELAKAKDLSPEQKAKLADQLESRASKIQGDDQGAEAGRMGYRDAAKKLRAEAAASGDAWIAKESTAVDPAKFYAATIAAQINPKQAAEAAAAQARAGAGVIASALPGGDSVLGKILDELKKLNQTTAKGAKVEVDGKDIVTAHKQSRAHARRPGA